MGWNRPFSQSNQVGMPVFQFPKRANKQTEELCTGMNFLPAPVADETFAGLFEMLFRGVAIQAQELEGMPVVGRFTCVA